MREEWFLIEEAPGYAISNYGRVLNTTTDRVLRHGYSNGYPQVSLRVNGRAVSRKIHRLVAMVFCPGYEPGLDVNHLDGDKENNRADNLEWTTRQKNIQHAFKKGLSVSGRRTPIRIIETGEVFESQSACAEAINGYQSCINAVLKGRAKSHRGYTFEFLE